MVDITSKPPMKRTARATGCISLSSDALKLIKEHGISKGNVLTTAELAGIQAAKQTGFLIPLCHPLGLTHVSVNAVLESEGVRVTSECKTIGQTGVEMEALTATSVALLTIYDMCKAVDHSMRISAIHLLGKIKEEI